MLGLKLNHVSKRGHSNRPKENMMMPSNGNIFRVIGPLWGESIGHRWIPLSKTSDAELWCILWSAPEQTVEQTIETLVIWDAIALIFYAIVMKNHQFWNWNASNNQRALNTCNNYQYTRKITNQWNIQSFLFRILYHRKLYRTWWQKHKN